MREDEFIETVRREADLDSTDEARDVATATFEALGERITEGAATRLADPLPAPFDGAVTDRSPAGEAEPYALDGFVDRVSDRSGIEPARAILAARAVASATDEIAPDALAAAREQLPSEFDVIFEPEGPITFADFLGAVERRMGGVSTDEARAVTRATIRTLGERLTAGQARDLSLYLPDEFTDDLVHSGDHAVRDLSFEEFLDLIADRSDRQRDDVREPTAAVCRTIADAASDRELAATLEQLPNTYRSLFSDDGR